MTPSLPRQHTCAALEDLIAPVPVDTFLADYWRRDVLHVDRDGVNPFASLVSVADVGRHLASYTLPAGFLRVVSNGLDRSSREWAVGRRDAPEHVVTADPARLMSFLAGGATIVINEAGRTLPGLIRICVALEEELGDVVQANVYITPPSREGLLPHTDGHDVMVLQIHGSKQWRLYGPAGGDAADGGRTVDRAVLTGRARRDVLLKAGDVLYVPRHHIHEASTDGEPSIHVTLGFPPLRWADALRALLGRRLDEPVSIGAGESDAQVRERLAAEVTAALASGRPLRLSRADGRTLDLGSWFSDVMRAGRLSPDSRVMRRAGTHTRVEDRPGGVGVRVGAASRDLGAPLDRLARALLSDTPVRIGDARGPWPDEMTLHVARTLIDLGALEVVAL